MIKCRRIEMNTQTPATREYDGKKFGRFEQVPRHSARHSKNVKKRRTHIDELNAQRIGTVAGVHKASVESGRRKK